jgi:hypothetical protein
MDMFNWLIVLVLLQVFVWPNVMYREIDQGSCYLQEAWNHDNYLVAHEKCTIPPLVVESIKEQSDIHLNTLAPPLK